VLAPALRERYSLSLPEVGVVLAAEWIGLTFAMLPWGFAVDRFGERWTLTIGLGGCSACLAGAAFAPDLASLVLLLGLAGLTGASVQSGSGRAVMRWFHADERGLALGIRQTAVPVGGALAAVVLPLLGGTRAGFLFLAAFVAVGAAAGAIVLRAGGSQTLELEDVESSLRDRQLWLVCGVGALYVSAQVALMGFVVLFLHDDRGFSPGAAAGVLAASQVVAAALRIGMGRWSDVTGSRVRPLRLTGSAMTVALVLVALLATAADPVVAVALAAATAVSMAWNGIAFTLAAELGGRRGGAAIGLQQTVLAAVGVATPIAFAAIVSVSSWRVGFALAALAPLAGVALLRRMSD